MSSTEEKKRQIELFLDKKILLSPDILDSLNSQGFNQVKQKIENTRDLLVLNKDLGKLLQQEKIKEVNWIELERSKVLSERNKNQRLYKKFIQYLSDSKQEQSIDAGNVKILFSYQEVSRKRDIQDFVKLFNNRYKHIEAILRNRQELQNVISINRLRDKKEREKTSIIGLIQDKQFTKNNNIMLTLEDLTGTVKVFVNKNNTEAYLEAKNMVFDEVIGISGVSGDKIIFANNIFLPGVPEKEFKKAPEPGYAVFLSDLHVGSEKFLPKEFNKFLNWLQLKTGNEKQKEMAENVKYIFIAGDLVDGVGIYPEQERELLITDIYEQYQECATLLSQIPERIKVIIIPGNHDAMRLSEPQPPLSIEYAQPVLQLPNIISVSNPSLINIHSSENFSGFDVLLYHGYSFDYYVANVDLIRGQGGYDRADLIMKFLLERRHLAPSHASTLYIPDVNRDPLIIDRIPDFFVTGHIHKSSISNYKNVTLISGSCWQSKTTFQERVGHRPEPARVPILNLQTRNMKILKFEK